jgi:putative ABC transport system permease protein
MTTALYLRLARMNIKKNRKIYLPYALTAVGMVAMFYIVLFLASDQEVGKIAGGSLLQVILGFGTAVVALFASIFLFYSSSFVMKRRKTELGLYSALGMGKRHIARVLIWESAFVATFGVASGLATGILFSKLGQMVMLRLVGKTATFSFNVSLFAIIVTVALFAGVFFLILIANLMQVRASSPVELLKGGSAGEREPKANYVLAALGALLLGYGYYLALTVENPIEAFSWFFVAVILVILGSYLLFISGSVALLKILRRNKRYYYRTNHFVSVSGMFYRMKRHGAGLASICILSTMVLVMISSTTCLYAGMEDAMRVQFPRNFEIYVDTEGPKTPAAVEAAVLKATGEMGLIPEQVIAYRSLSFSAYEDGGALKLGNGPAALAASGGRFIRVHAVPAEDYTRMNGGALILQSGEAAVYADGVDVGETVDIGGVRFRVGKRLGDFVGADLNPVSVTPDLYVFVPDEKDMLALYDAQAAAYGKNASAFRYRYSFDVAADRDAQIALYKALETGLRDAMGAFSLRSMADAWNEFLGVYGGLLFLGILLGFTFVLAAVLIMYFKQITEGYEDSQRFDILKKVGMTRREIQKTINSQVLTVFALPLLAAAVHMAFAFPMVAKILAAFGLINTGLFLSVTAITILVFALVYVAAYLMTSRAYLAIVGGANGARA